jgi:GNAT superfamily N-acetyltransferase
MIYIKRALPEDVKGIVAVHMASFPKYFLTFLGIKFLQLLYLEIMKESGSVSLVALSSHKDICGFVVGVSQQEGLYKRLAGRKWFSFALAASYSALLKPSIIPRLFRALTYSKQAEKAACPALLMSIAVSPLEKGKGIGKLLINEFLSEMSKINVEKVCLTTDRDDNKATNVFYKNLGFKLTRQFQTRDGRWMNEYIIETKLHKGQ